MVGMPYFLQGLGHYAKKLMPKMHKFDKVELVVNLMVFIIIFLTVATIVLIVNTPNCDDDPNTTQTVCTESA